MQEKNNETAYGIKSSQLLIRRRIITVSFVGMLVIYFIFKTSIFVLYNSHSYANENRTLFSFLVLHVFLHFNPLLNPPGTKKHITKKYSTLKMTKWKAQDVSQFSIFSLVEFSSSSHNLLFFQVVQTHFFSCHLHISLVLFSKNKEINKPTIPSEFH